MADTTDGYLSGDPDWIASYAPLAPNPDMLSPQAALESELADVGPALVAADNAANERVKVYLTQAKAGFEDLTQDARTSGVAYADANNAATDAVTSVSHPTRGPV